jgi:hypothetical protein
LVSAVENYSDAKSNGWIFTAIAHLLKLLEQMFMSLELYQLMNSPSTYGGSQCRQEKNFCGNGVNNKKEHEG